MPCTFLSCFCLSCPYLGLIWEYWNDDARLFDMDGTLIDSTAGVIGAWKLFKEKYPGLDVEQILSCESFGFTSP